MNKLIIMMGLLLPVSSFASVNEALNETGISETVCDVREESDDPEDPEAGSLRHRLNLFNSEVNGEGEIIGNGKCLLGIYFLNPMTITLTAPLEVKAIETLLSDDETWAGTYISGLRENGDPLPVTIDARNVSSQLNQCAFMIEGGLNTFQQIHDLTLLVSDEERAICDEDGNNLMEKTIPLGSGRSCSSASKAKNCDYKDVEVVVDTAFIDKDGDGILDVDDDCPNDSDNNGHDKNQDSDRDSLADACEDDFPDDKDNDGYPDDTDLCTEYLVKGKIKATPLTSFFSSSHPFLSLNRVSTVQIFQPDVKLMDRLKFLPNLGKDDCASLRDDLDRDEDGRGDACDGDVDGDGLVNNDDPFVCDEDGDGDGYTDAQDDCPTEASSVNQGCPEVLEEGVEEGVDEGLQEEGPPEIDEGSIEVPSNDGVVEEIDEDLNDNLTQPLSGGCSLRKGE